MNRGRDQLKSSDYGRQRKDNLHSSPVGPDAPIRRACLPSVPSRKWPKNVQSAASSQNLQVSTPDPRKK